MMDLCAEITRVSNKTIALDVTQMGEREWLQVTAALGLRKPQAVVSSDVGMMSSNNVS